MVAAHVTKGCSEIEPQQRTLRNHPSENCWVAQVPLIVGRSLQSLYRDCQVARHRSQVVSWSSRH